MNRQKRALITEHANRVRTWAELTNSRRAFPGPSNLLGWCAIASARLWRELSAAGIESEIHMATGGGCGSHVFLVVDDHVVDVTASQFNEFYKKKLVIMHRKEAEQHWFYRTDDVFETADELRRSQIRTGWPKEQTALPR